jgi:hypothetical protein
MNQKKCKAARRLARHFSAGMLERQLLGQKRHMHKGKKVTWDILQAINNPQSTRGVYRQIKNLLRKGIALATLQKQAQPVEAEDASEVAA